MNLQRWLQSGSRRSFVLLTLLATANLAHAQTPPPAPAPAPAAAPAADETPPIKQEDLEQILAPIALYPDSLLAQIFMGATYPLEIVEADRWAKAHTNLKGDDLAKELEKQSWDPSVRSL